MTLSDWYKESRDRIAEEGLGGVRESAYQFYLGMWRRVGRTYNYGTHIYEQDWDLLIVLDACRWDLMEEVRDRYPFITNNDPIYSAASTSPEWLEKNFDVEQYGEAMAETAYVTGNLFSREHIDPNSLALVDEVWRYAWDDNAGTIHPQPVTDRAIATHREHSPNRMVVHYMQPHFPFVRDPIGEGMADIGETQQDVWDLLRRDPSVTIEDVWPRYLDNLRYVLDDVEELLENIEADNVIITADHGNLLGRSKEFWLYGHPGWVPIPALKRVPWIKTTATDERTREPAVERGDESGNIERKLMNLGYK